MTGTLLLFAWPPQEYDQTEHSWEKVRWHLQDHTANSLTLDIKKLKVKIIGMQDASLRLLSGTDKLQGIAEALNSLSLPEWTKGIWGGLIGTLAMFCCFTIIFCFVLRCTRKILWELMKKEVARSTYLLLQKQKGEYAGVNIMVSQLLLWLCHEKTTTGKD